jgi:molybdenum cofactor cytidylyltransferase
MNRIGGILLAAGESQRMGSVNKLALLVDGQPLLRRIAQTLLASRLQELVVVLGHEADQARQLIEDLELKTVYNEHYKEGQMTSVHCGLEALTGDYEGVMINLADQPLLTPEDINSLIDTFGNRERGSVLVPTHRGQRGNPIVLATEHRGEILRSQRNLGCKRLIESNPEWVTTVEMDTEHVVFDLDTPDDYADLQRRFGMSLERPAMIAGDGSCTESSAR